MVTIKYWLRLGPYICPQLNSDFVVFLLLFIRLNLVIFKGYGERFDALLTHPNSSTV